MPGRHPLISPSGQPYGPPATDRQRAELHRNMAPRESWDFEHDERIGLGRARDYAGVAPIAAEASLTVERHGHTVQLDSKGLLIDGKRVPGTTAPTGAETASRGTPITPARSRSPTGARSYCTGASWPTCSETKNLACTQTTRRRGPGAQATPSSPTLRGC